MEVLLILALFVGTCAGMFLWRLIQFFRSVQSIHDYLFSPEWRTIADCVTKGFNEEISKLLVGYYYESKLLKVRLDDHVRECKKCRAFIFIAVFLATKDYTEEDSGEFKLFSVDDDTMIPFDYFEANLFSASTSDMFQFRIEYKGRPRRSLNYRLGLKLPTFGTYKPA